ncbi:kelch-like protein 28 [Arctopsyche grandis]|uniref:kelch-like protein 28 n=1 Tax=Arctopsyche grandis TaxID=121162 RepID=UPI00406D718E
MTEHLTKWKIRINQTKTDAIFYSISQDIRLVLSHSLVLSSVSEYFNKKLVNDSEIPSFKQISIDNLDNEATQRIIDYCYTGEIAGLFQLEPDVKSCCEFMVGIINTENCLKFDETLNLHGCSILNEKVTDFILKNYRKVSQSEKFREFSAERLQCLLQMNLNVSSKRDVFDIVKAWVIHDMPNRKKHLSSLLQLIKLPSLPNEIIFDEVQPLCEDIPDCQQLLLNLLKWKNSPNRSLNSTFNWHKPRSSKRNAIAVVGGCSSKVTHSVDMYDPKLNIWWAYVETFIHRRNVSYSMIGDELIAMGGQDEKTHDTVLSINIKTGVKKVLPSLQVGRRGAVAATVGDVICIFGGDDGTKTIDSVEKWDPKTRKWSFTTPMITGRRGCGIAVLGDEIYLVGGWSESAKDDAYNVVEVFCPHSEKWRTCAPLNKARAWTSAAEINGKIYALGGRQKGDLSSDKIKSVECYDKNGDSWSFISDMSVARYGVAAGVLDNNLVVIGGVNGGKSDSFEIYNAQFKKWRSLSPLGIPRENSFIFSIPTPFCERKISSTEDPHMKWLAAKIVNNLYMYMYVHSNKKSFELPPQSHLSEQKPKKICS